MLIHATAAAVAASLVRESGRAMTEQEFEGFYRRSGRGLMSYITKMCGDATLAEDLFQKSYFLFLRANLTTTDEDHLRAYLFRIATNVVHDHWRRSKREGDQRPLDTLVEQAAPERRSAGTSGDFEKVLGELKPKDRALLWFAHVEELEHREIARRLGVQEKSVKVLLFRARKRIGAVLQQYGLAPGGDR
jgi:RNA polymerase sigma-70 factor (ECF subfamily)